MADPETVTIALLLLQWCLACIEASAQSPAAQIEAVMQAWPHDCSERLLPSVSHLGACAAPRPDLYLSRDGTSHRGAAASCAAAFDGNVSTFVEDVVLVTDRTVFGKRQPSLTGNSNGTSVGINLHGHLVHLTGINIVPRPPNSDWQPRKHPFSPNLTDTDWTTTLDGARVQASLDLENWDDLYTFSGVLAPYPVMTTIRFEAMMNASCTPYSAFRLFQPAVKTRMYFANSALGPVEMTETYALASIAELSFLGVRSFDSQPGAAVPFINYTCLASLPQSSARLSPTARRYPGAVNMSLVGPLRKCGASVWYTLDGSLPRDAWNGGGGSFGSIGDAMVSGGLLSQGEEVRLVADGPPGTVTRVQVKAVQDIRSGGSIFASRVTTEVYEFPQKRLVAVCPPGTSAYPGDGMWCYAHHALDEAKSFWEAEAACQLEGGHLASASSYEENAFLARLARKAGSGGAGDEGGGGEESVAWIGLYRPFNVTEFRWTDESDASWQNWLDSMPLHGAGTANPANGTCAYLGAGDWWKSECAHTSGKLCGGRAWGPWNGQWGDVVAMAEEDPEKCFGHPTTSMIPASDDCFQEHWVGTEDDDPCRQHLPYICKIAAPLVCAAGYYSNSGSPPCTACAVDTAASQPNSTACTPCRTGTHTDGRAGSTWCIVTVTVEAPVARAANVTPQVRAGVCPDCAHVVKSERWVSKDGVRLNVAVPAVGTATWTLRTDYSTCPPGVGNISQDRGLEVSEETTAGDNGTLVHHRLEFYAYATICCGVQGLWGPARLPLPHCLSLEAAERILTHFPTFEYLATLDLRPGYHTIRQTLALNRSTTLICSRCLDTSTPLHVADIRVITECLHADWDVCDPETYALESHVCPAGYTLLDLDLNPGLSRARLCLLFSRRAQRISQVRLVVGPDRAESLCTDEAGEGSPSGWEQLPVDLMDGFGGDLRLRICLLRDSVGMLANLTFASSNQGPSLTWTTQHAPDEAHGPMDVTPLEATKCTPLDYPGVLAPPRVWVCEHSFGNASAVVDGSGTARLIHVDLTNCAARQLAIAATPLPGVVPAGGAPGFGCHVLIERLTLLSGSTLAPMLARPAGEKLALSSGWTGMRSVCGACTGPDGELRTGCHGGGVLFHSAYEGSTLEIVDTSMLNNTAQCGGALMITGRARAEIVNSSFVDNTAGLAGSGSGAGGALATYSADEEVRVKQQWASGSWGTPRDLSYLRSTNPGTLVGEGGAWGDARGGVEVMVRGGKMSWNTAVGGNSAGGEDVVDASTGEADESAGGLGHGGGVAVTLGTFEFYGLTLEYNRAARGSQFAAAGVQGQTVCNSDNPPLKLARPDNCHHPSSAIMTSVLMQDCRVEEDVAQFRAEVSQRLGSATAFSCLAPVSTKCSVEKTKDSGWQVDRRANRPPAKRPGALYLQHATALIHASSFGDQEAPGGSNLTCWLQHSACLTPGDAAASCFAHGVWRFPCCQMDIHCPEM